MAPELMDGREAAAYLRISRTALWGLMARRKLPWYTVEGVRGRKFKREDLDKLIREGKAK